MIATNDIAIISSCQENAPADKLLPLPLNQSQKILLVLFRDAKRLQFQAKFIIPLNTF